MWTFGRKVAAGFALSFALLVAVGVVAYRGATSLARTSYLVNHAHLVLERTTEVLSLVKDAETGQRGFVITGDDAYLEPYQKAVSALGGVEADLRALTSDNPGQQRSLDEAEQLLAAKLAELKLTVELRRSAGFEETAKVIRTGRGKGFMDDLRRVLAQLEREEHDLLKQRAADVEVAVADTRSTTVFGTLFCLLVVIGAGLTITRSLTGQIGAAVGHVQSSSAELQAAATQQATGAREQSTAMSEIATTITELLATSRQIAQSAQRVAHIAAETATAARGGMSTVDTAHDSISSIRRQVDVIVGHMLELGRKSQQIGGVLEIVSELADQTNILALNATIEAVGAGDAGKRFAVVADEIRKLADRVGGSTKEIRGLIEDVRSAVNTTVMATEGGSKAVDAGTKQFGDVAVSFKQIGALVGTTTEAAREIELSTKQQATAVEQVNLAIGSVAQATRETESSSSQTLQAAGQLRDLSRDLLRLVTPQSTG